MEARVKSEHRWKSVTAFGGLEFVKSEFRKVPAGYEQEAQAHPMLEINVDEPKREKTPEEKAEWAAMMVKARADKKAKGG